MNRVKQMWSIVDSLVGYSQRVMGSISKEYQSVVPLKVSPK